MDWVVRKLRYLNLISGVKSFTKFKIEVSGPVRKEALEQNRSMLLPIYEKYINTVSSANMAASLELLTFMYTVCEMNRYTKLLDLGTGISSIAFRIYARKNPEVLVYSVDDDVEWLEKTRNYLISNQLDSANMYPLQNFVKLKETDFDFVLYDLNFVEIRIKHLRWVTDLVKKDGLLIIDDIHKPNYYFPLLQELNGLEFELYSLKPVTLDSFGRHSLAAIRH